MSAPSTPITVGLGAVAVGGVVDLAGGDLLLVVVGTIVTGLVGIVRVALAQQQRLAEQYLAEGRKLAEATAELQKTIRGLPDHIKYRIADDHPEMIGAMDHARDAIPFWRDSPPPRR